MLAQQLFRYRFIQSPRWSFGCGDETGAIAPSSLEPSWRLAAKPGVLMLERSGVLG